MTNLACLPGREQHSTGQHEWTTFPTTTRSTTPLKPVRDYVKHDSGNYKVMEEAVKSKYIVRSKTAKRGLARSHAAVVSGEIAGYETAQERPRELENKLYFALRDGTVLLAWIIEN